MQMLTFNTVRRCPSVPPPRPHHFTTAAATVAAAAAVRLRQGPLGAVSWLLLLLPLWRSLMRLIGVLLLRRCGTIAVSKVI